MTLAGEQPVTRPPSARPLAGPILIAISVIHIACTPVFYEPGLTAIIDDGVVNAVDSGANLLDARAAAFWYFTAGSGMALLGYLTWWVERRVGMLPAAMGWFLVAFTAVNVILTPVSGFWLFLLPAAVILWRARRRQSNEHSAHLVEAS